MKKLLICAAVSGLLFTSCQKEDAQSPDSPNGSKAPTTVNVSPVPGTFVKKVLLEEFTSATNGNAPQSAMQASAVTRIDPDRVITVSMHMNDIMSTLQVNRLMSSFSSNPGLTPSALVNRNNYGGNYCIPSTMYVNAVNGNLAKTTQCGIAINSTINGRMAQVDVHAGFANTYNGSCKLSSYLVEDKVVNANPAFYQANAYNTTVGSPFYNQGNPIRNYTHTNVVRKVISNAAGDAINATSMVAGGKDVMTYQIDLPLKYNASSKYYIVSFITDDASNEVLNVQVALLGTLKDWN